MGVGGWELPLDAYPDKFGPLIGRSLAVIQLFLHSKCMRQVACSTAVSGVLQGVWRQFQSYQECYSPAADEHSLSDSLEAVLRDYLVLGTVSRLKRVDLAVAVYLQMRQSGDSLMVVGDGPLKAELSVNILLHLILFFWPCRECKTTGGNGGRSYKHE